MKPILNHTVEGIRIFIVPFTCHCNHDDNDNYSFGIEEIENGILRKNIIPPFLTLITIPILNL